MHLTARMDYALRAVLVLASIDPAIVTAARLARAQDLPLSFLSSILTDLRRAGIVLSRRGTGGGFVLARSAVEISLGDIVRAVQEPLDHSRVYHSSELTDQLAGVLAAATEAMFDVIDRVSVAELLTDRTHCRSSSAR